MGQKLTIDQTAKELGISINVVQQRISPGELRAYRVGAQLVYVRW
jgi:excisionase family DNA binding protein